MRCVWCKWSRGSHDPSCPDLSENDPKRSEKFSSYTNGYRDGKARRPIADPNNGVYRLGWCQGDSAADYAENVREEDYH